MAQSQTNIRGLWRENQELRLELAATNAKKDDLIREAQVQIEFLDKQLAARDLQIKTLIDTLQTFVDSHEECTDFDGFTAQIVCMDEYHKAQEVIDSVKVGAA